MKVRDVMTRDPVTVGPDEPLKHVADLLVAHGISGLPVVGPEGEPLGVISEADLIVKEAGEPEMRGKLGWLTAKLGVAELRERLEARTVAEAMSSPAITIGPESSVAEAARTMIKNRVTRLPVVDERGRVCGIVTRADLVRVFSRSDQQIRREIEHDVILGMLWIPPGRVHVQVTQGEVTLTGRLETELDANLLPRLVARVPGVVAVTSQLTWETDGKPSRSGGHGSARAGSH